MENQLSELWSILEFANPGLLGPAKAFREQYAVPVERFGDEEAAQRLRRVTQPFLLRRLKTDKSIISDLPDKQEIKVWCNPNAGAGEPVPGDRHRHAQPHRRGQR